jgi:ribosome-associated toxin RatA of RatAB toxin-antitoxin module
MFILESIEINKPINDVFNAFANIILWKKILNDIKDIHIIYDDGYHQEFIMTVERPKGFETVRAIRFCEPYSQIEMFQTIPPPGFKYMQGLWSFKEQNNMIIVEAKRHFDFKEDNNTNDATKLRAFLKRNLDAFKSYLEIHA